METLTKEEVLHVADLARLEISDEEIAKYGVQLKDILTEIDKINECELKTDKILISPTNNINTYKEDTVGSMLSKEEIFKNSKNNDGEYIYVPRVIND